MGLIEVPRNIPSGSSSSGSAGEPSPSSGGSPSVTVSVPPEDAEEAAEAFELLRRGTISAGDFCSRLAVSHVFHRIGEELKKDRG